MKAKIISGMAVHVHHDKLFEYCYNYQERVDYIKNNKPKNEIKIRLKRFVMLSKEQAAILPAQFVKTCQKYDEAWQKCDEAMQKYYEARQKYDETWKKCQPQLEEIHKKIGGCKEWNGKE